MGRRTPTALPRPTTATTFTWDSTHRLRPVPLCETERQGRVLVVRIDHPPHNFMTAEMVRELEGLVQSLRGDRSVGAVVITGKPDDLYVTHYDVGEILRSVQRAGISAPPWLTAIVLR